MARSRTNSQERKSPKKGSFKEAGSSNLRRFGQSIRRIVKEVEEKTVVEESRETLVQRHVLFKVSKEALQENSYIDSKSVKNLLQRYTKLREMLKDCVSCECKWWAVGNLASQTRYESIPEYVERSSKYITRVAGREDVNNQIEESLIEKTSKQLSEENGQLVNDVYKLIKKYLALRNIVRNLLKEYKDSKIYPILPRYFLLKDMVKDATHHPDYKTFAYVDVVILVCGYLVLNFPDGYRKIITIFWDKDDNIHKNEAQKSEGRTNAQ